MRRHITRSRIQPKISTMPRQQSEAAAFLDIYKLVIEKKRLQQELQGIDQRRQQILDRLALLETQVAGLENRVHQIWETLPEVPQPMPEFAPESTAQSIAAHQVKQNDRPQIRLNGQPPLEDTTHPIRLNGQPPLEEFDTLFLDY